jgi:hypothetical protein
MALDGDGLSEEDGRDAGEATVAATRNTLAADRSSRASGSGVVAHTTVPGRPVRARRELRPVPDRAS